MKSFYIPKKIAFLFFISLNLSCSPQSSNDFEIKKIDIVKHLKLLINDNYVERDNSLIVNRRLDDFVKDKKFKLIADKNQLANSLTDFLRDLTNDMHFSVRHDSIMYKSLNELSDNRTSPVRRRVERGDGKLNSLENFKNDEILDGNIGHFQLLQMPPLEISKQKVDEIFKKLHQTEALIIDLRNNPGGMGGFIPYLMSYLFEEPNKELFTRNFVGLDSIAVVKTEKKLPNSRYLNKPVYVLINGFTGSAATNLAYTLQQHNRAKIIGEPTGVGTKGANSAMVLPIKYGLIASIPSATIINYASKDNWNDKGLIPDHKIKSDDAFLIAYKLALEKLGNTKVKPQNLFTKKNEDKIENNVQADFDFKILTGTYEGERNIFLDGEKLMFKRGSFPPMHLKYLGNSIFELQLPQNGPMMRKPPKFRFDLVNNETEKITYLFENGRTEIAKKISN